MARIEVDEADFNAAAGVTAVVNRMMQNPAARKLILQARKTVDPNVNIPEIDAAAPINASVDDVRGELSKLRQELAERDRKAEEERTIANFNQKWEGQASQLRAAGWRQAGIDAVKTFAEENGIVDLSIAADAWQARNPTPPTTLNGGNIGLFGSGRSGDTEDTYIADLMKSGGDNDARLDQEIRATLNDLRANR
jgi:hypothetical protein